VKAARDFAHATLSQWDACVLFDDAAVVISELVTNAVRYGLRAGLDRSAPDARVEVVLLHRMTCIVCVVTDPNPGPPVRLEPDFAAETGRGLCVVESLSRQWGWTPLEAGRKAVWASLPLP
jgi:two-component sensor histidine kinase